MTIRTLTIEPFGLVGNANPEVSVTISLVDGNEQRIQGLVVADGSSIIDRVTIDVRQDARTVDLYPQPDLDPVLNFGSDADQSMSYYLVDILNTRTRYHHQFRTQVDVGDPALSWAEFANGQGPLEGGDMAEWQTHIADAGIHVPVAGDVNDALVKLSGADGDTGWGNIGALPLGGDTGTVLTKRSAADHDTEWDAIPPVQTLDDYGETAQDVGTVSGAVTIDISQGQSVELTLSGDATSFAVSNPSAHVATSFSLLLVTGGFDVLAWTDVAGWFGAAPDISSGGTHGFAFELVAGSWYGTHKGQII